MYSQLLVALSLAAPSSALMDGEGERPAAHEKAERAVADFVLKQSP